MHLFYEDLGIKQDEIKKFGSINFVLKKDKLFIAAYHPGQTQIKREVYVNDIVKQANIFWKSRE